MEFLTIPEHGKVVVYGKGKDGNALPVPFGMFNDQTQADLYIGKAKDYWDDDYYPSSYSTYVPKLDDDDPRVNYKPLGGNGTQACANCNWFNAYGASCGLIYGPVVATGKCDLWLGEVEDSPLSNPVPVTIVTPDGTPVAMNMAAKTDPIIDQQKGVFAQIGDLVNTALKAVGVKSTEADRPNFGFKVYASGKWMAWWSNNFEDRVKEIFTEAAHDNYIARIDSKEIPMPELWYRHMPCPSGVAEWVGRVDHLMLAAGKFYDTEVGRKFEKHYQTSGIDYTVSHGFLFPSSGLKDGLYTNYNTYEISPLLPGEEANQITGFTNISGVKEMVKTLSAEKIADLGKIIGVDQAAAYMQIGEQKSQELEAMGVKFKSMDSGVDEVARTAAELIAQSQKDFAVKYEQNNKQIGEALTQIGTALNTMAQGEKDRNDRLDKIEAQLKAETAQQSRASQAQQTVLPPTNPYIGFMQQKQDAAGSQEPEIGGVLGEILKAASTQGKF